MTEISHEIVIRLTNIEYTELVLRAQCEFRQPPDQARLILAESLGVHRAAYPAGHLYVNMDKRTFSIDDRESEPFSGHQWLIASLLYGANGALVHRETVASVGWPNDSYEGISDMAIAAMINRIRVKLDAIGGSNLLVTVTDHGWRLLRKPDE